MIYTKLPTVFGRFPCKSRYSWDWAPLIFANVWAPRCGCPLHGQLDPGDGHQLEKTPSISHHKRPQCSLFFVISPGQSTGTRDSNADSAHVRWVGGSAWIRGEWNKCGATNQCWHRWAFWELIEGRRTQDNEKCVLESNGEEFPSPGRTTSKVGNSISLPLQLICSVPGSYMDYFSVFPGLWAKAQLQR